MHNHRENSPGYGQQSSRLISETEAMASRMLNPQYPNLSETINVGDARQPNKITTRRTVNHHL